MPLKPATDSVFEIDSPGRFEEGCLAVFRYQAAYSAVYGRYLSGLSVKPEDVKSIAEIPFLPIAFFKTHRVHTGPDSEDYVIFTSSGTTGSVQSKHLVSDISIYEKSYRKGFELFYGDITEYCVLALLPSYSEREDSSLIYMTEDLIKRSGHPDSGFYLHNYEELILKLQSLEGAGQKTILIGVTYALLDLAEKQKLNLKNTIVMETGGMKGKRKEMVREELHAALHDGLGIKEIHSEYGMTELLSQAYSKGDGIFNSPPWMKILIRDTNDPFAYLPENKTGGINVIDLANINSCSFIATQDLGKFYADGSFEVLGRFDNSDIRGCNLLVE